jgi:hypothetical protein
MLTTPPTPADHRPAPLSRQHLIWGGVLLLAFILVQGTYAVALNRLFYAQHGPFYDSVSYLGQLVNILDRTKTDGFLPALKQSTTISTVFLPFGLVPFFGKFVTPDRAIGVWLQCLWVLLCTGSLTFYLARYRRAGLPLALSLSILFVSIHAVYFWSGGLSDFRIDLPFGLLFSTVMVWLLIALREQSRWAWVVFGAAAGLCCLSRATAPVFLVLTCVPMVAVDLFAGRQRLVFTLKGMLLAAGLCALISGWFYLLNWKYLHYYYFIWNLDANARLPLAVSVQHLRAAADSVGPVIFITAGLCSLVALVNRLVALRRQNAVGTGRACRQWLGEVEWRTLTPALIPVGYLVLSGAGPNSLVSLPSAFGIVLFLLCLPGYWPDGNWVSKVLTGLALLGAGLSASTGIQMHFVGPGSANPISAYAEVTRAIEEQAASFPRPEVRVSHFSLGNYHNVALTSYLIYDKHLPGHGGQVRLKDKTIVLVGPAVFAPPTKVNWDALPGADDEQRIQHIVDTINREADLVVMPTQQTAEQLAIRTPGNHINHFTARIRQRLLETGRWGQVSNVFRASYWEEDYCVMRNNLR